MRKIIPVIILASLSFTAAGCKQPETADIPDLTGDISVKGSITCNELTASAELTRTEGVWTIDFTSPDSIKGLSVTIDGNAVKYALDGIEYEYPANSHKSLTTAVSVLADCIADAADKENISVHKSTEKLIISGSADNVAYNLTLDEDGNIIGVSAGGYVFDCSSEPTEETSSAVDVGLYLK